MNLTFASFNLYQFAEPPIAWYNSDNVYSPENWAQKTQWVREKIDEMEADVIGFQEVFSPVALENLCNAAGYQHFHVVDQPKVRNAAQNIYESPVVAIASKFPISSVLALSVESDLLNESPVSNIFQYSRKPIRAEIQHPEIGKIIAYVTHLKSKRPIINNSGSDPEASWLEKVFDAAKANSFGQIAALVQRGVEATMVYHQAMKDIESAPLVPLVIMGDMNAVNDSVVVDALSNRSARFKVDDLSFNDWPDEAKVAGFDAKLYDGFHLASNQNSGERTPTHYYKGEGTTLDYIFVSNACNERRNGHLMRPYKYTVIDEHLLSDGVGNDKQSDHALVLLEMKLKTGTWEQ